MRCTSSPRATARGARSAVGQQSRIAASRALPRSHAALTGSAGCALRLSAQRGSSAVCASLSAAPATALFGKSSPAAAPAGYAWREQWWPVAFTSDLDPAVPSTFTLLDERLVLWSPDAGTTWNAYADRCPHRLAPLSEGRITSAGELECPYHGWTFAGQEGTCTSIPQDGTAPTARLSPRSCATAFSTRIAQGMVFVRLSSVGPEPPLPTLPELEEVDPKTGKLAYVYIDIARDLPYDYTSLLENVLDVSHVPFTHHATVSNRINGGPVELEVQPPGVTPAGFTGLWQEGPRKGKLGAQSTFFKAPQLMYHSLVAASLGTTLTVVYATPSSAGKVRLMARFPFKFNSPIPSFVIANTPRWVQHQGQNGVLEDDVIFLAIQEAELAKRLQSGQTFAQANYLPLAQDAYVLAFRKWLNDIAGGGPWNAGQLAAAPRETTKEALLDRYHSHTVNCVSCMKALKGVRAARAALLAFAALAGAGAVATSAVVLLGGGVLALTPAVPLAASALLALAMFVWHKLAMVEKRFLVGELIPKRNLVEKKAKNTGSKVKLV